MVEAPAAKLSDAVKKFLRSSFMSYSKWVVRRGATEREQNDGESRTIANLGGINNSSEAVGEEFRGASKGVEGEDSPGKTPRGEACLAA